MRKSTFAYHEDKRVVVTHVVCCKCENLGKFNEWRVCPHQHIICNVPALEHSAIFKQDVSPVAEELGLVAPIGASRGSLYPGMYADFLGHFRHESRIPRGPCFWSSEDTLHKSYKVVCGKVLRVWSAHGEKSPALEVLDENEPDRPIKREIV